MGLFTRKKSSFTSSGVNLGSSRRPVYVRPTKEDLESLRSAGRISLYPHTSEIHSRSSKKKKSTKKPVSRSERLRQDFISWSPEGTDQHIGFAKVGGYDSQSHLGRNLNFRI